MKKELSKKSSLEVQYNFPPCFSFSYGTVTMSQPKVAKLFINPIWWNGAHAIIFMDKNAFLGPVFCRMWDSEIETPNHIGNEMTTISSSILNYVKFLNFDWKKKHLCNKKNTLLKDQIIAMFSQTFSIISVIWFMIYIPRLICMRKCIQPCFAVNRFYIKY